MYTKYPFKIENLRKFKIYKAEKLRLNMEENPKGKVEIMAPAGNFKSLAAAINAGADSVYFGVGTLNMRARGALNFQNEDLPKIAKICRENNIQPVMFHQRPI